MYFFMIILCLIWGFNFVVMKLGNDYFPPAEFAAFRFLTGSIVLIIVYLWKKIPLPKKSDVKWLVLCGIFQTAYFNVAIQISLNYIDAGLTSVLTYSMPLFLSIMAHLWIPSEKLSMKQTLGIMIGIIGLFIAMDVQSGGSFWIMLLGVSSAVSWAIANVIFKLKLKTSDTVQFTTWQMSIGTIGLFIYTYLFEAGESSWGTWPIMLILYSGVIASALAFVMWSYILRHTEASKASIPLLLVPIMGVVCGYVFLNETLNTVTLFGIALVLLGIWFVNSRAARKGTTS